MKIFYLFVLKKMVGKLLPFSVWIFLCGLMLIPFHKSLGYIPPAEQLMQLMGANFKTFRTLAITQLTLQEIQGEEGELWLFTEKMWMETPNAFYSRVLDENIERDYTPDNTYRQFLMASNRGNLMSLLSDMGVNIKSVGLTRIDGIIAYRIGDMEQEAPKILIEKERFLPLLIVYRPTVFPDHKRLTVRLKDYRQVEEGWYPFEISNWVDEDPPETYVTRHVLPNVPMDPSLFSSPISGTYPVDTPEAESPSDEERLRSIIKTFEEKYR